ncbi:methyltransferase domain-containing protein [Aneurinibacillus sp. BA2021]|nr:methyltransferase domain-containing protein [Aneurinibacillus sp. BA2021]
MAVENKELNDWAISLLHIKEDDRILEIGFGPGIAIKKMSKLAEDGFIAGVDVSETMLAQAQKRNEEAIAEGNVSLTTADVKNLPDYRQPFDKILTINSLPLWEQPAERVKELRAYLKPGGNIAIVLQSHDEGATDETAEEEGRTFVRYLTEAGYTDITMNIRDMSPVNAVCVIGTAP